jgi:2-iminobutanoate/2-iminopropanoate deaminase
VTVTQSKSTPEALKPGGHLPSGLPFSEGMAVGDLVFLSGQLGTFPGKLELNNATREAEFRQIMDNIVATLKANGMTTKNIVKCLVMLEDMNDWPAFNEVYVTYFEQPYPARSAFGTTGLALGARAEVECIAVR